MAIPRTILDELADAFIRLDEDAILEDIATDRGLERFILDLIRIDQLFEQGIDEDGLIIGVYSKETERRNPQKVAGTPYTLLDTGDFYDSFTLEANDKGLLIDADGQKNSFTNLFDKYGDEIIGLTDENLQKVINVIKDRIIQRINQILESLQ